MTSTSTTRLIQVSSRIHSMIGWCWQCALCVTLLVISGLSNNHAIAAALECPAESRISVDFENGAGWDMCWQSMQRENIVLSDIYYKSADRESYKVMSSLRLAQLHVTYDDNKVAYNDVTQFGLGGGYVSTLTESDCIGGELINIGDRAGMCRRVSDDNTAYSAANHSRLAESLTLFSISQIGAYAYIVTWKFFDDGSIAPSIGAAGSLQRSSDVADSPHGRALGGVEGKSYLSHTHNYYWRIDFDLGDEATDDRVSEVSFPTDQKGRRARTVEYLDSESARKVDSEKLLAWYITDGPDDIAQTSGYVIEPLSYGHKLVHKETEPFTDFDFFVTRQSDCERFISENAKFNPDCGEDILQFVNGESLIDQDIVAWHRVSFHHVPRNEDRHRMHSHWDGFFMQARNLSAKTPGHSGLIDNLPPVVVSLPDQSNTLAEQVEIKIVANDPDGDELHFHASGLPAGISISETGEISGEITRSGSYQSIITVSDSVHVSTLRVNWQVGGGGLGIFSPLILVMFGMFRLGLHRLNPTLV